MTVAGIALFIIDVVGCCPELVCLHRTSISVSTAGGGWCGTTAWAAVSWEHTSPRQSRSSQYPSFRYDSQLVVTNTAFSIPTQLSVSLFQVWLTAGSGWICMSGSQPQSLHKSLHSFIHQNQDGSSLEVRYVHSCVAPKTMSDPWKIFASFCFSRFSKNYLLFRLLPPRRWDGAKKLDKKRLYCTWARNTLYINIFIKPVICASL